MAFRSSLRSTFIRVLKRLTASWNLSPQAAGVRYLTDEQGNTLVLFTTEFNPAQTEPVRPGNVIVDDSGNAIAIVTSALDGETDSQNQAAVKTRAQKWNETTWDRERNNTNITILASAARTASTNSADQTNFNARGLYLMYNVTAVSGTTPTLGPVVQAKDPLSATYTSILGAGNITGVTQNLYLVYPGVTSVATTSITTATDVPLPRTFRTGDVIGGTTPSFTYSVGGMLIL